MERFSYQERTGLDIALHSLIIPEENPVLDSMALSIKESEKYVQKILEEDPDNELGSHDLVFEEGCLVDDLVGIAFVVCQRGITSVVSSYSFLQKQWVKHRETIHKDKPKKDFVGIPISSNNLKRELMGVVNPSLGSFSKISVIDAFANYYKHRDEWTNDWNGMDDSLRMKTAEIVRFCGADPGSLSSNCRQGYLKLTGETYFGRLDLLWTIGTGWANEIRNRCFDDLDRCGCYPEK